MRSFVSDQPNENVISQERCAEESCFLAAEAGAIHCILHEQRVGKQRAQLAAALDEYTSRDIKQIRHAYLREADLSGLYITLKNFQYSDLTGANFSDARLFRVGFDFSALDQVNFENVIFDRVDLRRVKSARQVAWHNAIFASIEMPGLDQIGLTSVYGDSSRDGIEKTADVYRNLKEIYRGQGHYESAGQIYEQEMHLRRKLATGVGDRLWLTALWLICGYGERPGRAFFSFFVAILGFGLLYTFLPLTDTGVPIQGEFLPALYFSVVTFTTLGYGDIQPHGLARFLASVEALAGIFLISLFVFVFCRKMIR